MQRQSGETELEDVSADAEHAGPRFGMGGGDGVADADRIHVPLVHEGGGHLLGTGIPRVPFGQVERLGRPGDPGDLEGTGAFRRAEVEAVVDRVAAGVPRIAACVLGIGMLNDRPNAGN